jgi:nucleoside-diphosphate-sugar epimerase
MGLNLDFSIARARRELGYQPPFRFAEAMRTTTEWYRQQAAPAPAQPAGV